jgi:hypothetical protein
MTLITLIALNAALGVAVVGGLLVLLGRGIRLDRIANRARTSVATVERARHERLAA